MECATHMLTMHTLLKLNSMAAIGQEMTKHQAAVQYPMRGIPEQAPAVNVPSKHDEAVQVNPAPVWVHELPLASPTVQSPASSAPANSTLASQGSAAHAHATRMVMLGECSECVWAVRVCDNHISQGYEKNISYKHNKRKFVYGPLMECANHMLTM